MTTLKDILKEVSYKLISGHDNIMAGQPEFDSRNVVKGSVFFAGQGTQTDGHQYIEKAIEKGAATIIVEDIPKSFTKGVNYVKVSDSALALASAASAWFGFPSTKLKLVGITGTNGKTSIATLLYHLVRDCGYKSGLLSTIKILVDDQEEKATHTTPDPVQINCMLAAMVEAGCEYCFMEVSSHALVQKRVAGLQFSGAVFTNLTHDHLDYHKTFSAYLKAKKLLFDSLNTSAIAITNLDDKNGLTILQNCNAKKKTYALKSPADYKGKILQADFSGMQLQFNNREFFTTKTGTFNAFNLLAVYACAIELGFPGEETMKALSLSHSVAGRFEIFRNPSNITAIVDYAHTPDALENVLKTITDINKKKKQVITVFGCGGDRDKSKRPVMCKIALAFSDRVIITSDNPRTEDPATIINDIEAGINENDSNKVLVIENREQAIKTACALANKDEIILVAGKGHENYQEIKGVRHHFDDKEMLEKYLMK